MSITQNKNLDQLAAAFLAEVLRSRTTSLRRAAEISHRVITTISSASDEAETLSKLVELEKDFEEVTALKQALHFGHKESDTKVYEKEIKEYASKTFSRDMVLSSIFLQEAAKSDMTIQKLCVKYPDFCNFMLSFTDKAPIIKDLQTM